MVFSRFFPRPSKRTSSSDASSTYNFLNADRTGGNDVKHLILKTAANVNKTACNLRYTKKFCLQKWTQQKKKRHDFSEGGVLFLSMPFLPMPSIHLSKSAGKSHHFFHITGQLLQANPAQKPGLELGGVVSWLHIWDFSGLKTASLFMLFDVQKKRRKP